VGVWGTSLYAGAAGGLASKRVAPDDWLIVTWARRRVLMAIADLVLGAAADVLGAGYVAKSDTVS